MTKIWVENGIDVNPAWNNHIAFSYDNITWQTINKSGIGVYLKIVNKNTSSPIAKKSLSYTILLRHASTPNVSPALEFDLADVQGHAGWLNTSAGLNVAIAEITEWLGDSCCEDTVAQLALISHREDAAHSSGSFGIMNLAVRNDALADLTSNDGDYSPVITDVKGRQVVTGNIGGFTSKQNYAVTTVATAYSANDNIGGIQTLTNILRTSGGTGILEDISFWALSNQKPNLLIDFWHTSPATGTYTDDAAQVIAGDHTSWLGSVEVATSDWKDTDTISRCSLTGIGLSLKGVGSANLYMTIQDKTGVTFGSTSGLFFTIGELQD